MAVLVVDFAQLRAAMTHIEQFGHEVAECLEDIEHTVTALRASWQGDGSDAQAQAQRQWEDGAAQMKAALSALEQVVETADKNYSAAVSKNGQMWQA